MPLQNFVDQSGPVVSAAFLNGVDQLVTTVFNNTNNKVNARAALTQDLPLEVSNGGTGVRSLVGLANALLQTGTPTPQESANGITPTNYTYPPGDVRRYGADVTGASDSTTAINNALLCNACVTLPEYCILMFTSITMPHRQSILQGCGQTSVLVQTGTGTAITCLDTTTAIYPGDAPAYVNDGQFYLRDFTLYTNGAIGINFGNNRTTGSVVERVYMKPFAYYTARTSSTYVANTTAISCVNSPYGSTSSTYQGLIRHCMIAGYQYGVTLDQTVNYWIIDDNYFVDDYVSVNLAPTVGTNPGTNDIKITNNYAETGMAGCRGVVFGAGGGNAITLQNNGWEFTQTLASSPQAYAYDFTANGSWLGLFLVNNKYLLTNDGSGDGAYPGSKYIGTVPATLTEVGYGTDDFVNVNPLEFSGAAYKQYWVPQKIGGFNPGILGRLNLGRSDNDQSDSVVSNDTLGNLSLGGCAGVNLQSLTTLPAISGTPTVSGSTGTITFASAHGLSNGNTMLLTGFSPSGWNGYWTVAVSSTTVVTVTFSGQPPAVPTTVGSASAYLTQWSLTGVGNLHGPAGSTGMTKGFLYVPAGAGAPTGVPAAITGTVPLYVNTSSGQLYAYYGGTWNAIA
jgi:hypothetical protein